MKNKQTAVEWLKLQLEEYGDPQYCELTWEELDELCEQAKEMEKEQIMKFAIKAVTNAVNEDINNPYNLEQLFAETYGSKGNDEHIVDTNEMVYKVWECCGMEECICNGSDKTKTNNMKIGTSSLMDSHLVYFSNKNSTNIKSGTPTSSQTEISDEVTRLEVIDKQGRVYSQWNCSIELSYQDDGKTLKIFVNN